MLLNLWMLRTNTVYFRIYGYIYILHDPSFHICSRKYSTNTVSDNFYCHQFVALKLLLPGYTFVDAMNGSIAQTELKCLPAFLGVEMGKRLQEGELIALWQPKHDFLSRHDLKIHKTNIKPSEMTYTQLLIINMIPVCFQSWVFFLCSQPCFRLTRSLINWSNSKGAIDLKVGHLLDGYRFYTTAWCSVFS